MSRDIPPLLPPAKNRQPVNPSSSEAYRKGRASRESGAHEVACSYAPGSKQYTQFAEGYCNAKPFVI